MTSRQASKQANKNFDIETESPVPGDSVKNKSILVKSRKRVPEKEMREQKTRRRKQGTIWFTRKLNNYKGADKTEQKTSSRKQGEEHREKKTSIRKEGTEINPRKRSIKQAMRYRVK